MRESSCGLVYLRNRWYDPNTGRFTQEDPIGYAGGINLYGYTGNDPVNFSDPFGLCCSPSEQQEVINQLAADAPLINHAVAMFLPRNIAMAVGGVAMEAGLGRVAGWIAGKLAGEIEGGTVAADAVGGGEAAGTKVFSKEKQALVDMAKADKRTGMTTGDMETYKQLNKELPDPFPTEKVRGPESHQRGAPTSQQPHGHVGPVDHIPIIGGNQ